MIIAICMNYVFLSIINCNKKRTNFSVKWLIHDTLTIKQLYLLIQKPPTKDVTPILSV